MFPNRKRTKKLIKKPINPITCGKSKAKSGNSKIVEPNTKPIMEKKVGIG